VGKIKPIGGNENRVLIVADPNLVEECAVGVTTVMDAV
jgi:hypothetical protein